MIVKDISYATIISVDPVYLIVNKINRYIVESNGDKYLTLVPTDESKDTLNKFGELWNEIKDPIRFITNKSNNKDKKIYENHIYFR